MFGRERDEDLDEETRKAIEKENRPYRAAGMDEVAAAKFIDECENRASGSSGHPWPPELKQMMHDQINHVSELPDVRKKIQGLQLQYEKALAEAAAEPARPKRGGRRV